MSPSVIPLETIQIASPCPASWDEMEGDDRVRFCGECRLNVYNIEAMTRKEAHRLIAENEGRLCLRLYRRADGTVLTRDCPIGLRALRRRVARLIVGTAALVGFLSCGTMCAWARTSLPTNKALESPLAKLAAWIDPPLVRAIPPGAMLGKMMLGGVCPPPAPAAPSTSVGPSGSPPATNP